jgi:hypothetical protein
MVGVGLKYRARPGADGRKTILVADRPLASSLSVMSLAHLRALKSGRTRTAVGVAAAERSATPPTSYCGASREPVYRTMDEATASGLELCASCLADFRKQQKVH